MLICKLKSMKVRDVEKAASEAAIMLGYSKLKDLQMSAIVPLSWVVTFLAYFLLYGNVLMFS